MKAACTELCSDSLRSKCRHRHCHRRRRAAAAVAAAAALVLACLQLSLEAVFRNSLRVPYMWGRFRGRSMDALARGRAALLL